MAEPKTVSDNETLFSLTHTSQLRLLFARFVFAPPRRGNICGTGRVLVSDTARFLFRSTVRSRVNARTIVRRRSVAGAMTKQRER